MFPSTKDTSLESKHSCMKLCAYIGYFKVRDTTRLTRSKDREHLKTISKNSDIFSEIYFIKWDSKILYLVFLGIVNQLCMIGLLLAIKQWRKGRT